METGINDPALRISVVDDDASALRRLLKTAGYTVDTFQSAEEFLARGRTPLPDCLVLDVHLGGPGGFDLDDRLAASHQRIATVFITAHDDPVTRQRATRGGAAEFLRKPFDDEVLLHAIRSAVARSGRRLSDGC